jgi:hypothetical protein
MMCTSVGDCAVFSRRLEVTVIVQFEVQNNESRRREKYVFAGQASSLFFTSLDQVNVKNAILVQRWILTY